MKKSLLFLLLALSISGYSQSNYRFSDTSAQWNVLSDYWCNAGPCHHSHTWLYKLDGDTIINGENYQTINIPKDTSWYNTVDLGSKVFVRHDSNNKVFIRRYNDTIDYMIYNFGVKKGDAIPIENPYFWNTATAVVDSVDSVLLDKPRKRLFVRYNGMPRQDIWIEGIGSIESHFLQPGTNYIVSDGPDYETLCFTENSILVHHNPAYATCAVDSVWSSVKDMGEMEIKVYPNPASSFLNIESFSDLVRPTFFQLYDLTGRMVFEREVNRGSMRIELHDLNKGLYLYKISAEQSTSQGKLAID
jgi:hypothetical protein